MVPDGVRKTARPGRVALQMPLNTDASHLKNVQHDGSSMRTRYLRKLTDYESRDARKPVFGVSDQVRHKPGCTVTEAG